MKCSSMVIFFMECSVPIVPLTSSFLLCFQLSFSGFVFFEILHHSRDHKIDQIFSRVRQPTCGSQIFVWQESLVEGKIAKIALAPGHCHHELDGRHEIRPEQPGLACSLKER